MKKVFAAAVIATVLAGLPALALAAEKTVESTILSVDPAGQSVTLMDGLTLTVSPNISTEALQPGEDVTVSYQDDGKGDPIATAIWIDGGTDQRWGLALIRIAMRCSGPSRPGPQTEGSG